MIPVKEITDIRSSPKMKRVLAYLDLNYTQDVTLKDVAMRFGIHPAYLCRRFKKEMGIRFHEYLLKVRIQTATILLTRSEKSIKEISYDVGFSRPEIFSKAFKRALGCAPSLYRAQRSEGNGDSGDVIGYSMFPRSTQMPGQLGAHDFGAIQTDLNVKK